MKKCTLFRLSPPDLDALVDLQLQVQYASVFMMFNSGSFPLHKCEKVINICIAFSSDRQAKATFEAVLSL